MIIINHYYSRLVKKLADAFIRKHPDRPSKTGYRHALLIFDVMSGLMSYIMRLIFVAVLVIVIYSLVTFNGNTLVSIDSRLLALLALIFIIYILFSFMPLLKIQIYEEPNKKIHNLDNKKE